MNDAVGCLFAPLADRHLGVIDRRGVEHYAGFELAATNASDAFTDAQLDSGSGVTSDYTRTGTLDGGVYGYIRVESWASEAISSSEAQALPDQIAPVAGMLIDMRYNHGGDADVAQALAGRFVSDTETPYAYYQRRAPDEDASSHELGPPDPVYMSVRSIETPSFDGPVAILLGPNCASACEAFASMMITLFPHTRTFGATTAASDSGDEVITLGDGATELYVPDLAVLKADGTTYVEWTGFAPDEPVDYTGHGQDEVLDAALAWLRAEASPSR